jgi:diguanylate cyclase (GGDEF)-like protein/PAS domain S-box-containing protein
MMKILLVEDNAGDTRLLKEMLKEQATQDIEVAHVTCMGEAESYVTRHSIDIIVLDLGLPDGQGLDVVRRAYAAAPRVALVVLTGLDDESLAVQALQEGAQDYFVKGQTEARWLLRALRYAIERKLLEESLFLEKERALVTLNSIADGVVCTDLSENITFLNLVAEKMTGWLQQEAIGRPMLEVVRILDDANREIVLNPAQRAIGLNQTTPLAAKCILVQRGGFEIPIDDSCAPIHDRHGQVTGAVVVLRDASAARTMTQQLTYSAEHDGLTGLPNRLLLNDRVGQAIALAQRHNNKLAVLYQDLDGFKRINDSLGHRIGDELLQLTAKRLVDCVRASDTVSRQGGDEFVVLLTEIGRWEDATILARRMLQSLKATYAIDQHDLHITASIGVSIYPDDGLTAEELIKNADTAMYQAKENGRESYKLFEPTMYARALERQFLEEGLRRALERDEFALHYQPKVCLQTGDITGAEALIRWTHPARGLISPAEFIPVAEDSGLILPIGKWVLRKACEQAKAWVDAGLPVRTIAVNISALEFRGDDFLENVFSILTDTGLDPQFLELEVTESVLMRRAESAAAILMALRAKGVQIAIDDFGTGYSSLSYLQRFSIDSLKIDQSFIRQITVAGDDTSIVAAIISMGRNLKLRVVAEGVETRTERVFLQDHHCDQAQGYYFSRPVLPEHLAMLLESGISGTVID